MTCTQHRRRTALAFGATSLGMALSGFLPSYTPGALWMLLPLWMPIGAWSALTVCAAVGAWRPNTMWRWLMPVHAAAHVGWMISALGPIVVAFVQGQYPSSVVTITATITVLINGSLAALALTQGGPSPGCAVLDRAIALDVGGGDRV